MKSPGRIAGAVESGLGAAAAFFFRRPLLALGIALAVSALGGWSARTLRVDTDMANMLPKSFESVKNIERLKKRVGGVGYVTVLVSGAEDEVLRRFAREIAPKLAALPTVRYVEYQRPTQFFIDRAMYYMDLADLREVYKRIRKRTRWEKLKANPLYVDLEDSPKPSIDLGDILDKYRGKGGAQTRSMAGKPELFYLRDGKLVLLVRPQGISTQIEFARRVVSDVRRVLGQVDPKQYSPKLKVELCGRYTKRVAQQDAIQKDLRLTSVVALALMLLYLGVHFRRVTAVALVIAPLLVGLVWTFGFAAALVDKLNLLSAFFGVILLGLGVDHGIHLLARVQAEYSEGREPEQCVRNAFGETGRAVLIAGTTTAVGFIGLSVSEFRGFREFGQIAAAGTAFVVVSYLLLLPALVGLVSRLGWRMPALRTEAKSGLARSVVRLAPLGLVLSAVGFFLIISNVPEAEFEYRFSSLNRQDLPSQRADRYIDDIIGRSQAGLVVLTETVADARIAAAELRKRMKKEGSGIDFVLITADFLPSQQQAKRKVLLQILRELRQVEKTDYQGKARDTVQKLKKYEHIKPFGFADLPPQVRRRFQAKDSDKPAQFVLAYANVSLSDGETVRDLAKELRDIPLGDGRTVSAAGGSMVLADVLDMVFTESPRVMAITVVAVFFTILLLLGGFGRALLCLVPAAVSCVAAVGLMPLAGVKFNYLNVVIMPVLFGLGVDGGVHLVLRQSQSDDLPGIVAEVGRAVAGALLTTALGFGALILAHHPGLSSFAKLALLGLGCNLLATLVLLPALVAIPRTLQPGPAAPAAATGRFGLPVRLFATVCGAGHGPLVPGVLAALAAVPVAWGLWRLVPAVHLALVAAVVLLAAAMSRLYLAGRVGTERPSELVVDSFAGFLVAAAWIPYDLPLVAAVFCLFCILHAALKWGVGVGRTRLVNAPAILGAAVIAGLAAGAITSLLI
ncbi:MAG: phosphatidylglycerophosphatase A [bacterium]